MTAQLTTRIERRLKKEAEAVLSELGLTPAAAVSMFYAQVVKLRGLPFRPSAFPALGEYGATQADAEAASIPRRFYRAFLE